MRRSIAKRAAIQRAHSHAERATAARHKQAAKRRDGKGKHRVALSRAHAKLRAEVA